MISLSFSYQHFFLAFFKKILILMYDDIFYSGKENIASRRA